MRPRSNPFAAHLTPEAETLLGLIRNRHDRCQLVGFLGHACGCGRAMDQLNEADLAAYEAALGSAGNARPKQMARDAAHAWNRMAKREGWPDQTISPKDNMRHAVLSFEALPKGLQADITAYLDRQSDEDIFAETSYKALAPATLKDRRGKICQLISLAVTGGIPLKALRSLKDLVKEATARRVLEALWERSGKAANAHAANLARLLRLIAKHHAGAPAPVLKSIGAAEAKLRPRKTGMTDHNKKKLRHIIGDEPALQRLVQLPQTVLASLDPARPTLTDALALQSCLAIEIELHAPMRAKNLAALDFAQHFDLVSPEACHIVIAAQDVKNDQTLNYELGPSFIQLLTLYRDVYWPLLAGKTKTTAMFISRTGRQKPPDALGAQVAKFLKARAGIAMNIHLFRHLAGYLFLKEHPGEYEPVRQVLGHKSIRTTVGFYLGLEQEHSFKRYDQIIQAFGKKEPEDVDA